MYNTWKSVADVEIGTLCFTWDMQHLVLVQRESSPGDVDRVSDLGHRLLAVYHRQVLLEIRLPMFFFEELES